MAIRIEQLTKRYDGRPVVSNVTLEVAGGELCVLLGPSGSGKSTILRLIAGLSAIDSGRILLEGRDLAGVPAQRRDCGFVFQSYALFRRMNVAENVEFALRVQGIPQAERRRRRDDLLELVGLSGLGGRLPAQLSGGQQQRVALARALAHRPRVLLLDEPFGALDARIRLDLRRSLKAIQRELRVTTLFVTHDQEEAFELADRVAVLAQGRLVEEGPPEELYLRPQTEFVAVFLGAANLWVGESGDHGVRLGPVEIPLAEPSVRGDGQNRRVQVLVRPEDVALRPSRAELAHPILGEAEVVETAFSGAIQRLRLRLPALPGVRVIQPPPPFGDQDIAVDATRSQHVARRAPLAVGDRVFVGIRRLHALLHPGLHFAALGDGPAATYGAELARLSQAKIERAGSLAALQELDAGSPCDLVIAPRGQAGAAGASELLEALPAAHLLLVGDQTPLPPHRLLVAIAVGEPGKDDVAFTGRLARHLGSRATVLTVLPPAAGDDEARAAARFVGGSVRTMARWGVAAEGEVATGALAAVVASRIAAGHDWLVIGAPLPDDSGRIDWGRASRSLFEAAPSAPVLIVRSQLATRGSR